MEKKKKKKGGREGRFFPTGQVKFEENYEEEKHCKCGKFGDHSLNTQWWWLAVGPRASLGFR